MSGKIVKDRGKLRNMDAVRYFGDDPLSSEDEQDFIDVDADDLGGWDTNQFERGSVKDEVDSEDERSFFGLPAPPIKEKRNILDEHDLKQFMKEERDRKAALGSDRDDSDGTASEADTDGSDVRPSRRHRPREADSSDESDGWETPEDVESEDESEDREESEDERSVDDASPEEDDDDPLASSPAPSETFRRIRPPIEPLQQRRPSSALSRSSPPAVVAPGRRRRRSISFTRISDGSSSEGESGVFSDKEYAPEESDSDNGRSIGRVSALVEEQDDESDDEVAEESDVDGLTSPPPPPKTSAAHHPPSTVEPRPAKFPQRSPLSPPPSQSPPPAFDMDSIKLAVASDGLFSRGPRPRDPYGSVPPVPYNAVASTSSAPHTIPPPPVTLSATAHLRPFFYQPPRSLSLPPRSSFPYPSPHDGPSALPTPPLSTVSSTSSSSAFSTNSSSLNPGARRVRFETTAEEEEDMSPLRPTRKPLHRKTSREEIKPLISRAFADELKGKDILAAHRAERKKRKREERAGAKEKKTKRGKMGLALVDESTGQVGGIENAVEDRASSEERASDTDDKAAAGDQEDEERQDPLSKRQPSLSKRRRIVDSESVEPESAPPPASAQDKPVPSLPQPGLSVPHPLQMSSDRRAVKHESPPVSAIPPPPFFDPAVKLEQLDPADVAIAELTKLAEILAPPRKPRARDMTVRTFLTTPTLMDSLRSMLALLELRRGTVTWGRGEVTGDDGGVTKEPVAGASCLSSPLAPSMCLSATDSVPSRYAPGLSDPSSSRSTQSALPSCANCLLQDREPELAATCLGRLYLPTVLPLPEHHHTRNSLPGTVPTMFCSFLDMPPQPHLHDEGSNGPRKRKSGAMMVSLRCASTGANCSKSVIAERAFLL